MESDHHRGGNHHQGWKSSSTSMPSSSSQPNYSYYTQLEEQVNSANQTVAVAEAQYRQAQALVKDNSEKVFIVYKFVHTPIEALIAGM